MTKTKQTWRLAKLPLAVSLASTLAAPAFGVTFNIGEIEGQLDSSLSVGSSWSVRGADPDLVGFNNGGDGLSQTSDDGHANFKRGETFSKIFKGIHDLELKYGDTGVFVRGKYWYDFELKDESRQFKEISDSNRKEGAQSSGAKILDAFVYHNYAIGDQPGSVRLGKQVVSWGESTFIRNSINEINPVDVSAFRRPGAEIKEGLIPVNMFYVAQSLTENLSAEAFYQLEWDQTVAENCGTFFSQFDIVADGCDNNLNVLTATPAQIAGINATITGAGPLAGFGANAISGTSEGVIVPRGGDRDARDSGQWGLAFRYMFEPLDTEFGAYFMNYHSRAPVFSATAAGQNVYTAAGLAGAAAPLIVAGNSEYFMEYPEDIQLYGLSFSTTLPTGTSWAGELSYRPNAPVQINSTDVLYSGVKLLGGAFANASILNGNSGKNVRRYCEDDGFVTSTSWGYRARAIWDYPDVFAGVNLKPSVSWSHDVDGYGPNGLFTEGAKAVSLGLDADYQNTYTASLAYTDFFDGKYNTSTDRDFVALSFGVNF